MNYLPIYLDTSALVKLVVPEPETDSLLDELARWPDRISSVLARVELHRALSRAGVTRASRTRADRVLASVALIRLDEPVLKLAATLRPARLRSLDALHLAAALSIGDEPAAFVTYDRRLAAAARRQKLTVLQPGC